METPTLLRHTHHECIKLGTSFLRRGKGKCTSAVFLEEEEGGGRSAQSRFVTTSVHTLSK